MIFHKYLKNADFTTVLSKLVEMHKRTNPEVNVKAQVQGYIALILNLIHKEANPRPEIIIVENAIDAGGETWDGCVRVHGTGVFHGRMLDIYYWENELEIEDLLGMEVQTKYSLEDTVAYCIWELSFCGFEPENFGNLDNLK